MAAFARVDMNLVSHGVNTRLRDASPMAQETWRKVKSFYAQHRFAPPLQLLPFTGADGATAGGVVLATGVASVIFVYLKKTTTATQNTLKFYDDATDDTTAGNAIMAFDMRAASNEQVWADPVGKVLATGLVVTLHTTLLGTSDGSAANGCNGFVVVR